MVVHIPGPTPPKRCLAALPSKEPVHDGNGGRVVPTTVVALLVFGVAVLPGAMYRWAYEREATAFGVALADRALRLVGVSLLLDALYAWPAFLAWRAWFAGRAFG